MFTKHKLCRKKLHPMAGNNVIRELCTVQGKTYVTRRCRQCRHDWTSAYWRRVEKQRRAEREKARENNDTYRV
jgi:hypothetical protein